MALLPGVVTYFTMALTDTWIGLPLCWVAVAWKPPVLATMVDFPLELGRSATGRVIVITPALTETVNIADSCFWPFGLLLFVVGHSASLTYADHS